VLVIGNFAINHIRCESFHSIVEFILQGVIKNSFHKEMRPECVIPLLSLVVLD
jgi:hypothetical protein